MGAALSFLSQSFFLPAPSLTENNCPDQTGRVFIVTGGYGGIGFELCNILYARNATVYIAGRSADKAVKAIANLRAASPNSTGRVEFLELDLANLATIKPAVHSFAAKESRLDVLVNNAGVMFPPRGSLDAHGHDLQMGTNCLGHFLLYQLLLPLLTRTAASAPTASVRVIWAASIAVHVMVPGASGVVLDSEGRPADHGPQPNYAQTKVGNVFFAREGAKSTAQTGIVHAAFNPGNLASDLQRHWNGPAAWITVIFLGFPAVFGAYTELWSALSPELTPAKSGAYVYPWGRFGSIPKDIEKAMISESEGGTGVADRFLVWCRKETDPFA
ncbi:unnamed protein product [Discula destructiva]